MWRKLFEGLGCATPENVEPVTLVIVIRLIISMVYTTLAMSIVHIHVKHYELHTIIIVVCLTTVLLKQVSIWLQDL